MAYEGEIATIPLGLGGLMTDAPHTSIPATFLIRAQNISLYNDVLQKDFGSLQWNSSPLPASVVQFREEFLNGTDQRVFAVCANGQVYKMPNYYTQTLITPANNDASVAAPASLNTTNYVTLVTGGNEANNSPRKMFIFTGYSPVQVISGDATQRKTILNGASDWSGTNQPFGGVIHRSRLFAFGNANNPHAVYASLSTNHEDFTTVPLNFNVYPGEAEKVVCLSVFRNQLYAFKYPVGAYVLIDTDTNSSNWYFAKLTDEFGACSPQSGIAVNNDFLVANNYGSVTSLTAAQIYGNVMLADVYHANKTIRYAQRNLRPDVIIGRHMVYYPWKRQVLVSYQSFVNSYFDTIMVLDYKTPGQPPKIYPITKDQPNCLGVISDPLRVVRPAYGAKDGYIYQMDKEDRWVGTSNPANSQAISFEAMTPHIDFGQGKEELAEQNKNYDFLEVVYEPTGDFTLSIDVYVDGRLVKTLTFKLEGRSSLSKFPLGVSTLDGLIPYSQQQPIGTFGRRIAFRMYNSVVGQDVRLIKLKVFFRISGHQKRVG